MQMQDVIKYPLVFAAVIVATILLAYLSYEHFEKYFLKMKMRYSDVKSSGTRHFSEFVNKKKVNKGTLTSAMQEQQ
jgi:peptidoglycan/LPS O-acetylase OafA/YrhL